MVELAHGRAGLAAVRNQILQPAPAPKATPVAPKATPVVPKATPKGPKHKVQGLTAISEAAEWVEESTSVSRVSTRVVAEVDAVWAEAGLANQAGLEDARPSEQASASTVTANAVRAACAARKGGLGIFPASKASNRVIPKPETKGPARLEEKVAEEAEVNSASSETSEEEVEVKHVSIQPRPQAEVVELQMEDEVVPSVPSVLSPSCADGTRLKSAESAPRAKAAEAGSKSASPPKVRTGAGHARSDMMEEAVKKHLPRSEETAPPTSWRNLPAARALARSQDAESRQTEVKIPGNLPESHSGEEDMENVEEEWAEIGRKSEELAKQARENKGKIAVQQDVLAQPVYYKEVHAWLLQDFGGKSSQGSSSKPSQGDCMDKEFVLRLKATKFDFYDAMHHRMLRTMYCKLSRCQVCPRVGSHWEVLGFQGSDPLTDLNRSGGLLNVVHMFFFFAHYFEIFKSAYHLSQDVEQNFPLAAVCINITKMVMDALVANQLSSLEGCVFEASSRAFCGGLHHFYWQWRSQKRTIRDTELTFKEIQSHLRHPKELMESLEEAMTRHSRQTAEVETIEFTDLANTEETAS